MIIKLWLPGIVVPKARPRFYQGKALLPLRYRRWKTSSVSQIITQCANIDTQLPLQTANVEILMHGKHNKRADIDNCCGAILDVLVQSGVLRNDNLAVVASLTVKFLPSTHTPYVKISLCVP